MDVTSDEIRSSRFQGTRHVYDRREVDAFLHRAASTLELYERKLAVTESHVESLEKALDLANSRVRSIRERDVRIGELEAALASAQHNYELEVERTEAGAIAVPSSDATDDSAARESQRRAEQIIEEARQRAEEMRVEAVQQAEQTAEEASQLTVAARRESATLIEDAIRQEAIILEKLSATRTKAEAALETELEAKRAATRPEMAATGERPADKDVGPSTELMTRLQNAEKRAAKIAGKSQQIIQQTEERARAAEVERDELNGELERTRAEAEAKRTQLMEDVELMVAEAVTQAEVDRDLMRVEAQARFDAAEGEREALLELARAEALDMTSAAEKELESLRRQAAQMRTALSALHKRFLDVGSVTAEDFELATALVDLDLRGLDQVVDLTRDHDEALVSDPVDRSASLPLKSKWAQPSSVAPRGDLAIDFDTADSTVDADEKASSNGESGPTWREKLAPSHPAASEPVEEVKESLGFYERRLAGLRARLQEARPDEY